MQPDPKRPTRRRAFLPIALLAVFLAVQPPAGAAAPHSALAVPPAAPHSALAIPPQGVYEGCVPGAVADECIARLESIRAAGFRLVLNYSAWYGSAADVLRYADAAAALGLKLIWPLNNPAWRDLGSLGTTYSSLFDGGSSLDNAEATALAIGLVANHPGTWGFYIGDELPAAEATRVRQLGALVRGLAPRRPQLYIARPGISQLEPFAGLADVAGADVYPIGSNDPEVGAAARSARLVTSASGARTAMVLQAFSWSQYRPSPGSPGFPRLNQLIAMRNAAIRHANPSMILWYSYQDILRSDDQRTRWRDLTSAAFSPLLNPIQ